MTITVVNGWPLRRREAFAGLQRADDGPGGPPTTTTTGMGSGPAKAPAPAPEDRIASGVAHLVSQFRAAGERAGLRLAETFGGGWPAAAKVYVAHRASTEEELAAAVAKLTAGIARANPPAMGTPRLTKALLEARLSEVRKAHKAAETPPQAVLDRPEVAQHGFPRWVTWTGLGLSIFAVLLSLRPGGSA